MRGDRDHQSEAIYVPVIRQVRHRRRDLLERALEADEFVVVAFQQQEDLSAVLSVALSEDSSVGFELRDESAERLTAAMQQTLNRIRSGYRA